MFQKTVVIIAILILSILLILIGVSLSKSDAGGTQWPPIIGDCPDYWVDVAGNGAACMNTHNLGTCNLINAEKMYSDQANTNSIGNTLTEYTDVSQDQCKNLCSGSALCFGTTHNASTQQCFLKTADVVGAETQKDPDYTLSLKNKDDGSTNTMDFTVAPFTGNDGTCAKYTWANNCGVVWDGVNSGNDSNPCNGDLYSD